MKKNTIIKTCKIHGNTEFYIYRRKNRTGFTIQCKSCIKERHNTHLLKNKERAISYLGGKCYICGYNKSRYALEFHHKDQNEKEYQISILLKKSWNEILPELKKCELVCTNCHKDIHYKNNSSELKGNSEKTKHKYSNILVNGFQRKCSVCGAHFDSDYKYDFHHINPNEKEFNISHGLLKHYNLEKMISEVKKCIMVCGNCHRELHAGLIHITNIQLIKFDTSLIPQKINKKYYCDCGNEKSRNSKQCFYCSNKISIESHNIIELKQKDNRRFKYEKPTKEYIEKLLFCEFNTVSEIGRIFGVSHAVVLKWIKFYKIKREVKRNKNHSKILCGVCGKKL